jgi:CubicO group peptidase (beta-lactamase class C family)
MVGMAQQDGFLNISDKTSDYLGLGWTDCTQAQEDKITIRHQLTMTSGLDDGVDDPYCTLKNCLIHKSDAGTRWAYHNAPYTLLDKVIEKATGSTLNNYVIQKLRNKTGFAGLFFPSGYNNVFYSTARSMARFGLLILNKGNWNGTQIMTDTAYFHDMTHKSQDLNEAYGFLWWLNGSSSFMVPQTQIKFPGSMSPDAPKDMISALGKNGQYLNVIPGQNLIWLRMGDAPDGAEVSFILNNKIWKYVNELECTPSGIPGNFETGISVSMFPNPASHYFSVESIKKISEVNLYTQTGNLQKSFKKGFNEMDISDLKCGFYYVQIKFDDDNSHYERLLVLTRFK